MAELRTGWRVLWADGRAQCWFATKQLAQCWRDKIKTKRFGCPVGPVQFMQVPKGARIYDYVPEWKG